MNESWNIIYYESGNHAPIQDFIEKLNTKAKEKLVRTFDLLEEFGTHIGLAACQENYRHTSLGVKNFRRRQHKNLLRCSLF